MLECPIQISNTNGHSSYATARLDCLTLECGYQNSDRCGAPPVSRPGYTDHMNLTVQLFASLAQTTGQRSVLLEDLPDITTADEISAAVFQRFPQLAELRESVIVAVNEEYVRGTFPIRACDEVALIPPVSGGAPNNERFKITADVLNIEALHELVRTPAAGAVSLFVGVVRENNLGRDVDYLEYEAYPPMAVKKMREIAGDLHSRWEITDVAMHHRTGRLEIGEASVVIAVASAHRKASLEACHYAIDRLKQIVPIWKKEVWTDGEHWIEGSLTPHDEAAPAPDSMKSE